MAQAADKDPSRASLLSRQIRDLERVFGCPLFDRKGKKLLITPIGRDLLISTKTFIHAVVEIRQRARGLKSKIIIGASETILRWCLIPQLGHLGSPWAGKLLEFQNLTTQQSVAKLSAGEIDMAIMREDAAPPGSARKPCGELSYSLVIPRSLLPQQDAAGIENLDGLPMVAVQSEGLLNTAFSNLTRNRGLKPRIEVTVGSLDLVKQMVLQGQAAGILPAVACHDIAQDRYAVVNDTALDVLTRKLSVVYTEGMGQTSPDRTKVAEQLAQAMRCSIV